VARPPAEVDAARDEDRVVGRFHSRSDRRFVILRACLRSLSSDGNDACYPEWERSRRWGISECSTVRLPDPWSTRCASACRRSGASCARKLATPPAGEAKDYLRTENFETGEVTVRFRDDPEAERKEKALTSSLIKSKVTTERDWITFANIYREGKGGYDGALRITTRGGRTESDGTKIRITDAEEALVVMRLEPLTGEAASAAGSSNIKTALASLPQDYDALLTPHAKAHADLFNRVTLDLNASPSDRIGFPKGARHGTVIEVRRNVIDDLR
jgi:hypothetical protein